MSKSALDLIDEAIIGLEAQLNLTPGESLPSKEAATTTTKQAPAAGKTKKEKKKPAPPRKKAVVAAPPADQPDICKLQFKVGQITKVWVHEKADKLYCEEIDCGEEAPRQIASGLRPHYTEEQMLGQRLLVVANLKAKNLVGFKSHGMVLCASQMKEDGSELVEFIEPPVDAPLGEIITFEGLPAPQPVSAAQVEKKKVFAACMNGMKTTADCEAAWDGHKFMTTAGPCKSKTIQEGVMR